MFEDWIGKSCKIFIRREDGQKSYYTVIEVLDASSSHISFVDKFGIHHVFASSMILQISGLDGGVKDECA